MAKTPHDQTDELLPWYATGQLEPADRAIVEGHLASCARCQRQLATERALVDQFQSLSPEVDSGWAQLRGRIESRPPARPAITEALRDFWHAVTRPVIAALATVQLALVALAAFVFQSLSQPTYVALGSAPVAASANVIVMFRPDAHEAELRRAILSTGATLVGGPTQSDAYLLHVEPHARPAALHKLQQDSQVTLAQPIDGPAQ
jgi:anti-sigma factor RsiW